MGHVALPILQQLLKEEMVASIHMKEEPNEVLDCPTCMQANFSRFSFSSSEATAKRPLDEVVMDIVGPLKLGAARAEYFLTIVDVYTHMTWVYVLSKKSDVAETVKTDWLPMVERQQDWLKAMESELKSIEENDTWELVEGHKAITSKWFFEIKSDADCKIERYKSRLVAKGYQQRSFMVVYVDDILIFSPSSYLEKEVMLKLQDKFKCKALGDVSFYLGLHIERDVEKRCMRVHQRKYLYALAANFGQIEGHVATPFAFGFKCEKGPEEESVDEEERRCFHSLVGSLIYAAVNTRPDVAFATG
ncbi:unnamed protein product [Closterium sp. NIES-54]